MAQTSAGRKALPTAVADGIDIANWADRYGGRISVPIQSYRQGAAEEGIYFIGTNATPATGIAATTSMIAYDATAGAKGVYFVIKNSETSTANTSKRIIPDFIKMRLITQAPTSATDWQATTVLDLGTRYTSGGSTITGVNASTDSSVSSVALVYAGAVTCAAATSSVKLLGTTLLRAQVPVILDQYTIVFGGSEGGGPIVSAAGVQNLVFSHPPVIIGPNYALFIHLYGTANAAAPAWEFVLGWLEK